jgi:hypothetical protein
MPAFFDQGSRSSDFTDPNTARTLEVVDWDEATGAAIPFKVTFEGGRWTIPSHHGYPADGKDRLAKTAAGLIGITKDDFRTDNTVDHEACGVLDPLDTSSQSLKGRGRRVTIKGDNGKVLADLIIGKAFEGREGFHLVRVPGQKRVYGSRINLDISTKFKDWIEADLTMIEKDEIDRVELRDYSIDEQTGRLDQRDVVTLSRDGDNWKMSGVPAGKEVDTYKMNNLIQAVDALTIEGVRPKPEGLTASLQRASGGIRITQSDRCRTTGSTPVTGAWCRTKASSRPTPATACYTRCVSASLARPWPGPWCRRGLGGGARGRDDGARTVTS